MGNRVLKVHETITFVFQNDLPRGPMEDKQERVSRKPGNQLTAIAHSGPE